MSACVRTTWARIRARARTGVATWWSSRRCCRVSRRTERPGKSVPAADKRHPRAVESLVVDELEVSLRLLAQLDLVTETRGFMVADDDEGIRRLDGQHLLDDREHHRSPQCRRQPSDVHDQTSRSNGHALEPCPSVLGAVAAVECPAALRAAVLLVVVQVRQIGPGALGRLARLHAWTVQSALLAHLIELAFRSPDRRRPFGLCAPSLLMFAIDVHSPASFGRWSTYPRRPCRLSTEAGFTRLMQNTYVGTCMSRAQVSD